MTTAREDAGVFDKTTGEWMMRVAAHPQPGQYVFDMERGYTFAAADEGHERWVVGDPKPFTPLTAEEIHDLEQDIHVGDFGDAGEMISRLLAEVVELRKHLDAVCGPRWREDMEALTRSRALLKRIEWAGSDESEAPVCPECRGVNRHTPGCALDALIGEKEGSA